VAAAIATARLMLMFIFTRVCSSLTDQVPGPRRVGPAAQHALGADDGDRAARAVRPRRLRHSPPPNLRHALINLDAVYRQLARPWPDDELAEHYHAAYERGVGDLPAGEQPPERPITLLATSIPRLISLAVAANVLHLLPTSTRDALDVAEELITTIDATAQQPAPLPPRPPI
jgi:hypothetical protein